VREGRAEVYPGGFKDYERASRSSRKETKGKTVTAISASPAPAAARAKYEEKRQVASTIEKKKRRVRELETTIAAGEKDLDALRGKIRQGPGQDWEKLAKMAHDEQALTKKVDAMLLEWARLSEEVK
jgi:ATP-binding cassette subfamily F protein 3